MRWPTSEFPICPGGSPTASPDAASVPCGKRSQSASNTGVRASSTAFPGPGGAIPQPSRMTRTTGLTSSVGARAADRLERREVERGATDERAVHVRQPEENLGVVRLDRAAVEHGRRVQRLHEGVGRLRDLRCRGLPRADGPDGLVRDDEPLVLRDDPDLTREHGLGLARLALRLGLAHARDHVESRLERSLGAKAHGLVRLAEVLPPLGVPDEGARHTELEQHRRRDLARERALELPVHVLRVDANAAVGAEPLQRRLERGERRADDDVDSCRVLRDPPDLRRELARLVGALEHLPVARDQHGGDLRR